VVENGLYPHALGSSALPGVAFSPDAAAFATCPSPWGRCVLWNDEDSWVNTQTEAPPGSARCLLP
jgi:hypothetical protein